MDKWSGLAEQFEQNRARLRMVAYRMLGSLHDAEDAVQEAWLRLSSSDADRIENLAAWLTTVVSRVCLDVLRSRSSRQEKSLDGEVAEHVDTGSAWNPEAEAQMADSVGFALLVVLDRLEPAERLAFVLHDMFAVPFDQIAGIVGRTPTAARQLASRARRRVQGGVASNSNRSHHRASVEAFIAALRRGDFEGLLAVLDPDVIVRVDAAAARAGAPSEIHGAVNWAKGAVAFSRAAGAMEPAIIDGDIGLILAPGGKLGRALKMTFVENRIATVDIIADPLRLSKLQIRVVNL